MMRLTGDRFATATWRVKAALSYKGCAYGDDTTERADATALVVPVLEVPASSPFGVSQSLAILNYLEEAHPTPTLLPPTLPDRAIARGVLNFVVCDIQPLLSDFVAAHIGPSELDAFQRAAYDRGFAAIDGLLMGSNLIQDDTLTIADFSLVPDLWRAADAGFDLGPYSALRQVLDRARRSEHFLLTATHGINA
ncbi:MAG: glutathione S-transferase C-terminal domain-containing protein [Pseudomonadota bacterium]